jgi:lysozyme
LKNLSKDGIGFLPLLLFLFISMHAHAFEERPDVTVCAKGEMVTGLDVSDFDPDTNWSVVQATGRVFTFIKATEGDTFHNRYFTSDWKAAKASGFLRSPYHFFRPNIDAAKQAVYFLKKIGTLALGDLPPMFDWEISEGVPTEKQIRGALLWLAQVESATHKTPIIYVAPKFWRTLRDTRAFARYPLFIANYEVSCPDIPAPWTTWTFWQQGTGPIDGVQANSGDLDVFNGSFEQLEEFSKR